MSINVYQTNYVLRILHDIGLTLPAVWKRKSKKKCSKPSWQDFTPQGKCMQKVPQAILASIYVSTILR